MDEQQDIRWQQRFDSYQKAVSQLTKFIDKGDLNELEEQGLIQAFEYTYELGWNLLKDYLLYQGNPTIFGSRDAIREAFTLGLIADGEGWMKMLQDRNRTTHTYNEEVAAAIAANIRQIYFGLFVALREQFERLAGEGRE
jgi:nucleotidyltransferase substrate binding protein (TIGR01987 family)